MNAKLITTCPLFSSSSCSARFCNRLCLSRSAKTHPLLCPAQNPASAPLLAYVRRNTWMALHALAQCTSRIMLSAQISDEAVENEWVIVRGLAEMGLEERFKSATYVYMCTHFHFFFSYVCHHEKLHLMASKDGPAHRTLPSPIERRGKRLTSFTSTRSRTLQARQTRKSWPGFSRSLSKRRLRRSCSSMMHFCAA
jgi:hypothetical protein